MTALHAVGTSTATIASETGVGLRTVQRIVKAEADPNPRPTKRGRRPSILTVEVLETIELAYEWDCTLYHDEVATIVSRIHGISCSRFTIGRALRQLDYTRKQVRFLKHTCALSPGDARVSVHVRRYLSGPAKGMQFVG